MEKKYKIYCLKHPETLDVRYVGATINSIEIRFYHHKYAALKKNVNTHVGNWIRSLYKNGLIPIVELLEEVDKEHWQIREIFWINSFENLTNIREGGQGIITNRSEDSRKRSADAHKKEVIILNQDMMFLKKCESVNESAEFLGVCKTAVGNALGTKKGQSVGNHYVCSIEDYNNGNYPKIYPGKAKNVYKYDEEFNLVAIYKNNREAAIDNNYKYASAIHRAIKLGVKAKGFYFSNKLTKKI